MNHVENNKTRWQRLWQWLKKPLLLGIPIGVVLLFLGAGSFQGVMVLSNQNAFCFSCHLTMDTIVQEYQASSHYGDGIDIPATCADCHVPHPFLEKMKVKIVAIADIYHMMAGTVTKENFESLRPAMAEGVWEVMKANDSSTCRNCHQGDNFVLEQQPQRARLNHQQMASRGETCIDCHQGLTHNRIVEK
ncbi:NapC/NirT family cytochrome c [Aestuariirhabdus sp. LZHN29]|uniref:NapC/NirT family cytochrome c n=1 Tax=Aestuariirhabdus sp. LZHN29 TaxID=3417462 RepID=UPI003CF5390A